MRSTCREELLEVSRRVFQLAQRNAPLRFALPRKSSGQNTPDIGDATEGMPAPYFGEPLEIAFNPQFLIEGIETVEGDEIAISRSPRRFVRGCCTHGNESFIPRDPDP